MAQSVTATANAADLVLEIERTFEAPRALIFKLWSSPEHIVRWWGPSGFHLSACEMDFREGGAWRFCMQAEGREGHWIHGAYREITSPERLSFTYTNDADGHEMLVTLDFVDQGNRTLMRFHQAIFLNRAERDGHRGGWSEGFEIFARYVLLYQTGGLSQSPLGWRQGEVDGVKADLAAAIERNRRKSDESPDTSPHR